MQPPQLQEIKPSAIYQLIEDLANASPGSQAAEIQLVTKVPKSFLHLLLQTQGVLFIRKSYRIYTAEPDTKYLRSEYEILRHLRHPNIVQYADFEQKQENRWRWTASLYMEYCTGGDLSLYTSRDGKPGKSVSEQQFWQIFFQLASALLYCHTGLHADENGRVREDTSWRRPVIHRDIKPANGALPSLQV
jgi:serine/threonine protein kinase